MSEYQCLLHCASVYLAESRRRGHASFAHTLLAWAGNKRREAMQIQAVQSSQQMDLFA